MNNIWKKTKQNKKQKHLARSGSQQEANENFKYKSIQIE